MIDERNRRNEGKMINKLSSNLAELKKMLNDVLELDCATVVESWAICEYRTLSSVDVKI